eukprot:216234-Pleurochrysis_carterae.AAC.3
MHDAAELMTLYPLGPLLYNFIPDPHASARPRAKHARTPRRGALGRPPPACTPRIGARALASQPANASSTAHVSKKNK